MGRNPGLALVIITILFMSACAMPFRNGQDVTIENVRVGPIVDGSIHDISGVTVDYEENFTCESSSGKHPCMQIGVSFDIVRSAPESELICAVELAASPEEIPGFSRYPNGSTRREFVLEVSKLENPVVMKTMIRREDGDRGTLKVGWSCRHGDRLAISEVVLINLGN